MPSSDQPSERIFKPTLRLRSASFADHQNELPHSLLKKVAQHAPASTLAWSAASVRAAQNLKGAEEIVDMVPIIGLQNVWDRCSSVVRHDVRRHNRPLRVKRKMFEDRLYFCKHAFDPEAQVVL